jgi:hypothetical protein
MGATHVFWQVGGRTVELSLCYYALLEVVFIPGLNLFTDEILVC